MIIKCGFIFAPQLLRTTSRAYRKITQKIKLILSTAKIKVNLHDIVFVHTKKNCEVSKSYNTLQKKHTFTQ